MAKKHGGKAKGKHDSPSDIRRRAQIVLSVGDSAKPDYTPKKSPVLKAVSYPQVSASELFSVPVVGVYEVEEISGLRVEILRDRKSALVLKVLYMPEGHAGREIWKKNEKTFLPLKFFEWPAFRSKVPDENMRNVQQLIYDLFRPYWVPPAPQTVLAHALKDVKLPKVAELPGSADIKSFFIGTPGTYAFPLKGPKATFVVEDLNGAIGYRLVAVEKENPLYGVKVPLMLSRSQILENTPISKISNERGGKRVRYTLKKFFTSFGLLK